MRPFSQIPPLLLQVMSAQEDARHECAVSMMVGLCAMMEVKTRTVIPLAVVRAGSGADLNVNAFLVMMVVMAVIMVVAAVAV